MFGLLKQKNPYEQEAYAVYAQLLTQVRNEKFYKGYGVPDSFDGRFELMLIHMFMILHVSGDAEFNQALFDATFADMDQSLREMGIGDMGIPKHMRRMMTGFNGRMHAYEETIGHDKAFEEALLRNLYGTVNKPDIKAVTQMKAYIEGAIKSIETQDVTGGSVMFPQPA